MISLTFDRRPFGRATTSNNYITRSMAICRAMMADIDLQHAKTEALRLATPYAKRRLVSRYARVLAFAFTGPDRDIDVHVNGVFEAARRMSRRGGGA